MKKNTKSENFMIIALVAIYPSENAAVVCNPREGSHLNATIHECNASSRETNEIKM